MKTLCGRVRSIAFCGRLCLSSTSNHFYGQHSSSAPPDNYKLHTYSSELSFSPHSRGCLLCLLNDQELTFHRHRMVWLIEDIRLLLRKIFRPTLNCIFKSSSTPRAVWTRSSVPFHSGRQQSTRRRKVKVEKSNQRTVIYEQRHNRTLLLPCRLLVNITVTLTFLDP